jgi:hypothetical protein
MIIPKDIAERDLFYSELITKCTQSQENRKSQYNLLRNYYLFGGEDGFGSSPFNKIYPHIDLLTSFLFSSETTKFMVGLGANAEEVEHDRVAVLGRAINDKWLESGADKVVSSAITWSLVNNTMLVKLVPVVNPENRRVDINPFPVHPGSFGVLREDIGFLDRQEAFVHTYYTTKSQLEIDLKDHPRKSEILESLAAAPRSDGEANGIDRLIMNVLQPLSQPTPPHGQVGFSLSAGMNYSADVAEDVVEQVELWVWDTESSDYQVVTKIRDGVTIYDRKNFFLAGEHPFVQICPLPLPFYFWGISEVAGLAFLQEWRNERVMQVRKLLNLQVKPPTSVSGLGIIDEAAYALFSEGGLLADKTGGMGGSSDVKRFSPALPNDLFLVIHEIDAAFSEHSGLPNTVQGKGEVGVRSGKQASELARLGSARIKKRSLVIEDALERMATLFLKLLRKYDATIYNDAQGNPFSADQFTSDFMVKVDAHSNSPIFVEDKKELAFAMLNAHMVTRERAIDMIDPPDKEILKREVREIEKREQAAAQQQQQAKIQEEAAKSGG